MQGKRVLITGGTSGIGRETAVGIAKLGAHVIVTGRDQARGDEGVADIKARSGSDNVELMLADFTSLAEIRRLAANVQEQYDRLDVLINNVGLVPQNRWETADGIEATLAVNHIAPLVFTHELLPLLKASAPSRVINVTGGQLHGEIDFDDLQAEKGFLALNTYSHAKKVMMAGTYAFARQLEGTGVALNAAYPGAANTNMTQGMKPDMVPGVVRIAWPLFRLFMSNADPAKAARSSIMLASMPEYEGQSGNYYNTKGKRVDWPTGTVAGDVPDRVWTLSLELASIENPITAS